jgi:phage baseplate assembly protein W
LFIEIKVAVRRIRRSGGAHMNHLIDSPAARSLSMLGRMQALREALEIIRRQEARLDGLSVPARVQVRAIIDELLAWHRDAITEAVDELKVLDSEDERHP